MAILRIPDPNEPPFPHNLPISDDFDVKALFLLVRELQNRVSRLENKVRELESNRR